MAHGSRTLKPLFGWRSAITESGLPSSTRHVALALSLHMNERGGSAFPGAVTLAKETGLNVSTVRERLNDLVEYGYLTLVEQGGRRGERRRANVYEASIPAPQLLASDDPSSRPTRRRKRTDPSPQPRVPLASDDPISTRNSPENSTNSTPPTPPGVELEPASPSGRPVDVVFAAWQEATGHRRAVLDGKRTKRIQWALKHYSLDDVLAAVRGVKLSAFHMGQNDAGSIHDDIELILRDAKHLEGFRDLARDGPTLPISASTRLVMGMGQ